MPNPNTADRLRAVIAELNAVIAELELNSEIRDLQMQDRRDEAAAIEPFSIFDEDEETAA